MAELHAFTHMNVLFWFVNRRKLSYDTFVVHLFLPSLILYLEKAMITQVTIQYNDSYYLDFLLLLLLQ